MSGQYDRFSFDFCYNINKELDENTHYNHVIHSPSVMRAKYDQAPTLSPAQNVDFHGPLNRDRILKESFLQGRGHTLSKCGSNQVIYLPNSVFSDKLKTETCERVDMQPMLTRLKPTCNGIRETDVYSFSLIPEHYQRGYTGLNSYKFLNTEKHTRMLSEKDPFEIDHCNKSYGSYATTQSFAPYT